MADLQHVILRTFRNSGRVPHAIWPRKSGQTQWRGFRASRVDLVSRGPRANRLVQGKDTRYSHLQNAISKSVVGRYTHSVFYPPTTFQKSSTDQSVSLLTRVFIVGSVILTVISIVPVTSSWSGAPGASRPILDNNPWLWIDVVYFIGNIKLAISIIKYVPQVWKMTWSDCLVSFSIEVRFIECNVNSKYGLEISL
jgi:hypothetical protein